jgi:hypothetical protein
MAPQILINFEALSDEPFAQASGELVNSKNLKTKRLKLRDIVYKVCYQFDSACSIKFGSNSKPTVFLGGIRHSFYSFSERIPA